MPALTVQQANSSRIVLGVPAAQRLSSLVNLVVIAIVAFSFFAELFDGIMRGDPFGWFEENPIGVILLLLMLFFIVRTIYTVLFSTSIVIDSSSRSVTRSLTFLGIPLNATGVPFDRVRRVVVRSSSPVLFSQSELRPVWQVALDLGDTPAFIVNSNGTHRQMLALGDQAAALLSRPRVDELDQAGRAQGEPIFSPLDDFSGGTSSAGLPPVALPGPLPRSAPARPLPEKALPANTLTLDSASEEHARFEDQAQASGEVATTTASSTSLDATPIAGATMPPLGASIDTGVTGPVMPSIGVGIDAGQPPLGPTSGSTMGEGMGPVYSAPLGEIKAPETPIPDMPSVPSAVSSSSSVSSSGRRTLDELKQAVASDPMDSLAFYQMARILHSRRSWNEALAAYQSAVRLDPMLAAAYNDMAVLLLSRGEVKQSEAALRRSTGLDPFSGAAHYNLGVLLLRTGRRVEAQSEFQRAVASASDDAEQRLFTNALAGRPEDFVLTSNP